MGRQLLILAAAFLGAILVALALGAKNLGTALGIGQLVFGAALVYVLMRGGDGERAGGSGRRLGAGGGGGGRPHRPPGQVGR